MDSTQAERIDEARKRLGLTQTDLARRAGVSHALVSYLISGKQRLTEDLAEKLAEILQTSKFFLLYGIETRKETIDGVEFTVMEEAPTVRRPHPLGVARAAVVGRLAADPSLRVVYDEGPTGEEIEIPTGLPVYEIVGHSMSPVFWEGQHVAVDWDAWPRDGDLAAVVLKRRDDVGGLLVKQYHELKDGRVLLQSVRPMNPDTAEMREPDIFCRREDIRRAGRVKIHFLY